MIYLENGVFAAEARALLKDMYSIEKGIYHYKNMATRNYLSYLKDGIVPLKKYFYALRPLLAIRWIERHHAPDPIEFGKLKQLIPAVPELNTFIETELERLKNMQIPTTARRSHWESLNSLFRKNLT